MNLARFVVSNSAAVAVIATAACFFSAMVPPRPVRGEAAFRKEAAVVAAALLVAEDHETTSSGGPGKEALLCGGFSDLVIVPQGPQLRFWVLTDRGPKTNRQTPAGKVGVLLQPDFRPAVYEFTLGLGDEFRTNSGDGPSKVAGRQQMVFRGRTGKPVFGCPNGCDGDERLKDPLGQSNLGPDPNGIDSEGLARLSDGSLWLSEEYRPSLIEVSPDGVVLGRYVPQDAVLQGADYEVHDTLPACYEARRPNRGFESLALSSDENTLWALLQSPLDSAQLEAARQTGNVRMLAFDIRERRPVAEFIYRLGDPADPAYLQQGAPPDDGKLCAMAAIDNETMLVLEQADDGTARLYRCSLAGATNTLGSDRPLEAVGRLADAGVVPLRKTLVVDLAPLMPQLAADITDGAGVPKTGEKVKGLKLEGLAIVDSQHIALVNDNDFNVDHVEDPHKPTRRSCLWIIALPEPLVGLD